MTRREMLFGTGAAVGAATVGVRLAGRQSQFHGSAWYRPVGGEWGQVSFVADTMAALEQQMAQAFRVPCELLCPRVVLV